MANRCFENEICFETILSYLSNKDVVSCSQISPAWGRTALNYLSRRLRRHGHVKIYCCNVVPSLLDGIQTVFLDLTGMALPESNPPPNMCLWRTDEQFWNEFNTLIGRLVNLRTIKLSCCPTTVIDRLTITNPLLHKLKAIDIRGSNIRLSHLIRFTNLMELHLQFEQKRRFRFSDEEFFLPEERFNNLQGLIITGVVNLDVLNVVSASNYKNLRILCLGNCMSNTEQFTEDLLVSLDHLETLRLEKYGGTSTLLRCVGAMRSMKHLEVIDVYIHGDIQQAIASCNNLEKLLIAPYPDDLTAINNREILCGVVTLRNSLRDFCWVFSNELYSSSCDDIIFLNELPVLVANHVFIPPLRPALDEVVFDPDKLSAFIRLFLPSCKVNIQYSSYENSYLRTWLSFLN